MKVGLAGETLAYRDLELTLYRHGGNRSRSGSTSTILRSSTKAAARGGHRHRRRNHRAGPDRAADRGRTREPEAQVRAGARIYRDASGPEHRFTMVNEAYRTLVAGRDVVGRTVAEALPEVVEQDFVGLLDQVYASGEPHIGRGAPVNLQHDQDGALTERYLDFIYQPIVADGATTGIFIQGHDVTEQHETEKAIRGEVAERLRAEAALRTLNNTLERRVDDDVSGSAKVEEQLRQVQKMEAVGQLTGGIAHDFNNMLAVIIGGLDCFSASSARRNRRRALCRRRHDGAQRAATLTQRLLAFSRQQPLAPEP